MRTDNSIKNSITVVLGNAVSFLIAFIAQAIFIRILGAEYLGLNGLFSNIITVLSIFELGIGNAIVYSLYKPIVDDDHKKISALLNFYKKAYRLIILAISLISILILPFIKTIVGNMTIDVNVYAVYILFILSTISSYMMVYKRNLVIANQQNYIINIIHIAYLITLNITQLAILYFTRNYYLHLVLKIVFQLLENAVISIYVNRHFDYLDTDLKLDKKSEDEIFSKIKALIFHKIGGVLVLGTDNIIISYFLGIKVVGLYTNYNLVVNAVNKLFGGIISSQTASVGNLLVLESGEKRFEIFKKLRFLNYWISVFTAVSMLILMQPFIKVWVGHEYLLDFSILAIIVLNYYQMHERSAYSTFKDSAGIWREDKFVPLIESLLNIVFSIILLSKFGLAGVFIGTIMSSLVLWCYSYPKFVYKKLFNRSYSDYIKESVGYLLLFFVVATVTYLMSTFVVVDNTIIQIVINALISLVVPNLILVIIYRKTDNYKYFKELIKKIISKFMRK